MMLMSQDASVLADAAGAVLRIEDNGRGASDAWLETPCFSGVIASYSSREKALDALYGAAGAMAAGCSLYQMPENGEDDKTGKEGLEDG